VLACEDFTAASNMTVTTPLVGTITAEATGRPGCGVTLSGNLSTIPLCEGFTASGNVQFTNQARGNLVLSPTGPPSCGVTIDGNIDVLACENFQASSSVTINSPLVGNLILTPTGRPSCGVTLGGSIGFNKSGAARLKIRIQMCCIRLKVCVNGEIKEMVFVVCCGCPNAYNCYPAIVESSSSNTDIVDLDTTSPNNCTC
jgi:hypothetical protein